MSLDSAKAQWLKFGQVMADNKQPHLLLTLIFMERHHQNIIRTQTSSIRFNVYCQWDCNPSIMFAKSCASSPSHSLQKNLSNATSHWSCSGKCVLVHIIQHNDATSTTTVHRQKLSNVPQGTSKTSKSQARYSSIGKRWQLSTLLIKHQEQYRHFLQLFNSSRI